MPECLADLAVGEQTGVGIGGVGEPVQHRRKQATLDRRGPADSVGQRLDVAKRTRRVGEAQCGQAVAGLRRCQADLLDGQPGHRLQQRLIEQPFVQTAHEPGDTGVLGLHPLGGGKTEGTGQPAHLGRVTGQGVHPAQALELETVLGATQEAVGVGKAGGVPASHIAAAGKCVERGQGRGGTQLRVGPAVHQLEQLDGELHIAQPAGAELEVTVGVRPG